VAGLDPKAVGGPLAASEVFNLVMGDDQLDVTGRGLVRPKVARQSVYGWEAAATAATICARRPTA
jgi:hypothetical protein